MACCPKWPKKPIENLLICPPYDHSSEDCPPFVRRSHEFDPHNPPEPKTPDPRPFLPCTKTCCACRPGPLRKRPMMANLKLRQLADCYNCRVSEGCHNRRKVFYQRWQTYLDRMPKRFPNMDYNVYSCNDYVDLGINNDFVKYDTHLGRKDGPRTNALKNFLWMKNLEQENYKFKKPMMECASYEPYCLYIPPIRTEPLGLQLEKKHKLYHEDGITVWKDLVGRPEYKAFVEGATPYNCVNKPFRKDTGFSNPVNTNNAFSSGNDPPFKEFRDLKMV